MNAERAASFPIGASATIEELERDPHPLLARLRESEPVSWLPVLDGWLVTRRDLALEVMRDAETYTVDDPRFSTGQVVGPSMLSLDGAEHERHRDPFARPFRLAEVRSRFDEFVRDETERLIDEIAAAGEAELRRSLAGPLSVAAMVRALGLDEEDAGAVLGWYDAIVAGVTAITAGEPADPAAAAAFEQLSASVTRAFGLDPESSLVAAAAADGDGLAEGEVVSNAAVLLFGGIETTEGMIANAIFHVLSSPEARSGSRAIPLLSAPPSRSRSGSSRPPRSSTATRRAPSSSAVPGSGSASSSRSRWQGRTAIRRSSRSPIVSTSRATTLACT